MNNLPTFLYRQCPAFNFENKNFHLRHSHQNRSHRMWVGILRACGLYHVYFSIVKHSLMALPIPLHSLVACFYLPTIVLRTSHIEFMYLLSMNFCFFILDFKAKL